MITFDNYIIQTGWHIKRKILDVSIEDQHNSLTVNSKESQKREISLNLRSGAFGELLELEEQETPFLIYRPQVAWIGACVVMILLLLLLVLLSFIIFI